MSSWTAPSTVVAERAHEAVRRDVDGARAVPASGTREVIRQLGVHLVERRLHGIDRGLERGPEPR